MIILRETTDAQDLNLILKGGFGDTIVIKDDETNIEVTETVEFNKESYYQTCSLVFDLKENNYYTLTVYFETDVVYNDKIFCTNQVIEDYTINKDVYNEPTTKTEYTIFE